MLGESIYCHLVETAKGDGAKGGRGDLYSSPDLRGGEGRRWEEEGEKISLELGETGPDRRLAR